MIVKLALGIVEIPQPSPAFENKKPYEYTNTILYPPLEVESMARFPIIPDKPRSIGGTGQILRTYNTTTVLPKWTIQHNPVWPIRINQKFSQYHTGIDLDCNTGEPIYSVNDGVVTQKGWYSGYGLLITIQHSDGWISRYAHNSKIFVKVGEQVKGGQIIGNCGSTGRSSGSHLHAEFIYNNEFVNPYKYLQF